MSTVISRLVRKFKVGALELSDPLPASSLDDVHEVLVAQYPTLRHTRLFESDGVVSPCNTFILYEFVLQPVKTQG